MELINLERKIIGSSLLLLILSGFLFWLIVSKVWENIMQVKYEKHKIKKND